MSFVSRGTIGRSGFIRRLRTSIDGLRLSISGLRLFVLRFSSVGCLGDLVRRLRSVGRRLRSVLPLLVVRSLGLFVGRFRGSVGFVGGRFEGLVAANGLLLVFEALFFGTGGSLVADVGDESLFFGGAVAHDLSAAVGQFDSVFAGGLVVVSLFLTLEGRAGVGVGGSVFESIGLGLLVDFGLFVGGRPVRSGRRRMNDRLVNDCWGGVMNGRSVMNGSRMMNGRGVGDVRSVRCVCDGGSVAVRDARVTGDVALRPEVVGFDVV